MEWCNDLFQPDSTLRVIRGIPWYNASPEYFIVSRRLRGAPTYREEGLGFRVVLDVKEP
jgi:formylglycine-generating enzyme required for sulfatase activity